MLVKDLLQALELARGSLLRLFVVPVLAHFCFTKAKGKAVVYSYNGNTATVIPLDHNLDVALPGEVLLELCNTFPSNKTLEFSQKDSNNVNIICGRTVIDIAALSPEHYHFEFPKLKQQDIARYNITKELYSLLTEALSAAATDAMEPAFNGVLFSADQKAGLRLYGSDMVAITKTAIQAQKPSEIAVQAVLPRTFCEQILALSRRSEGFLELSDGWCRAVFGNVGEVYGKPIACNIPKYEQHIALALKTPLSDWMDIPRRFEQVLTRMDIATQHEPDGRAKLISKSGILRVQAKGTSIGVDERIKLAPAASTKDFSLLVSPTKVMKTLKGCTKMRFMQSCIAATSNDGALLKLVAVAGETDEGRR